MRKRNGLTVEIRRRQIEEQRRRNREVQAANADAAHQGHLDRIRQQLHEAAARTAGNRLAAAMAKTTEFDWVPWGYELPAAEPPTATCEPPILRPAAPMRLVVVAAPQRTRSRWGGYLSNLTRILSGAIA